jgi:hypothetical protein
MVSKYVKLGLKDCMPFFFVSKTSKVALFGVRLLHVIGLIMTMVVMDYACCDTIEYVMNGL